MKKIDPIMLKVISIHNQVTIQRNIGKIEVKNSECVLF